MKEKLFSYGVPEALLEDLLILDRLKTPTIGKDTGGFKLMLIDTETTGLDFEKDEVIEIGYVVVEFNTDGTLGQVVTVCSALNQPDLPIMNSKIHGITDEDVLGQFINWDSVAEHVSQCHLIAAHNSGFDRRFLERYCPAFETVAWTCSFVDAEYEFSSKKLDYLAYKAGFFYEAHRALIDVYAMLEMMRRLNVFPGMLKVAKQKSYRVSALGAPFSAKDELKARKYKPLYVKGKFKTWYTTCKENELNDTVRWLKEEIGCHTVPTKVITSKEKFSVREE